MKFEDLKLVQKWREYAGPKDERLEAENAKIYKIGFVLLSFGMLAILFYQFIARQVAWVHSDASEMPHLFATPFEAAMYAWLVIVMLICVVLQTRKGYVDTNLRGLDYIEAWLAQLERETMWIAQFDVDSCISTLERVCPDYRGLHINLYDLLFAHASALEHKM